MNISIAICVIENIRLAKRETEVLQKMLEHTFDDIEIAKICYKIEQYCLQKWELEKCQEYHLQQINVTETINSFAPNIHTK